MLGKRRPGSKAWNHKLDIPFLVRNLLLCMSFWINMMGEEGTGTRAVVRAGKGMVYRRWWTFNSIWLLVWMIHPNSYWNTFASTTTFLTVWRRDWIGKNVDDKQDAPWHIVLESINPVYCVLSSLALWLELNLKSNPVAMSSPFVFCISDNIRMPERGLNSKAMADSKCFKSNVQRWAI